MKEEDCCQQSSEKFLEKISQELCIGQCQPRAAVTSMMHIIREKTLSKYYHRLYRKAKTIVRDGGYTPAGRRISCKKLYEKYSCKGTVSYQKRQAAKYGRDISHMKLRGNFLDYVERAQFEFEGEPIDCGTKRHMQKIRKSLNRKL